MTDPKTRTWFASTGQRHTYRLNIKTEVLGTLEFELLDADGKPMADERYEVEAPDGLKRKGKTNGAGYAKEENLATGECTVTFPDIEKDALKEVE